MREHYLFSPEFLPEDDILNHRKVVGIAPGAATHQPATEQPTSAFLSAPQSSSHQIRRNNASRDRGSGKGQVAPA
jgi:hypothetical protein